RGDRVEEGTRRRARGAGAAMEAGTGCGLLGVGGWGQGLGGPGQGGQARERVWGKPRWGKGGRGGGGGGGGGPRTSTSPGTTGDCRSSPAAGPTAAARRTRAPCRRCPG